MKLLDRLKNFFPSDPKQYKTDIYRLLLIYLICLKNNCLENLFSVLEILKQQIGEEYPSATE